MLFTKEMIAPCGLDCSLCAHAHKEVDPCPGCNGPVEYKPFFCAERCGILNCEHIKTKEYDFCDVCPDFPCETMQERENRYMNQYPLKESPYTNLKEIRKFGMDGFLEREKARWSCPECGKGVSIHTGICSGCGKYYTYKEMDTLAKDI